MKPGVIIVIEDDAEDQELFREAISELGILNPLIFFGDGVSGLEYLQRTMEQPFIIFCDINVPLMNGLQLREHIDADETLRRKSIPFIFYTTSLNRAEIEKAYKLTVQGFFVKENTFTSTKEIIRLIIDYWGKCKHPNTAF
jgi:CheY-like chemotaxis protein